MTGPAPPLLCLFLFNVAKTESSFFFFVFFYFAVFVCFFFLFSPQFKRGSTVYDYKLNEDEMIILYKHSREQSVQPPAQGWLTHSTNLGVSLTTVQKEDLRNHVDPHTAPIPLSLRSKVPSLSPCSLFPRSWVVAQRELGDYTLTRTSSRFCSFVLHRWLCLSLPAVWFPSGQFGQGHPRRADTCVLTVLVYRGSLPGPWV